MRVPKEFIFAGAAVICVIVAGLFYTSDRRRASDVYHMVAAASYEPEAIEESFELVHEQIERIKIYIAGAVVNPGVYELDEGSRIEDALILAGGPTSEADLLRVNLAARLSDEQQIIVPKEGEVIDKILSEGQNIEGNQSNQRININTADEAKLMELPGVGPVTASNIVAHREEHGDFQTIEDIKRVTRIGERTFENLKDLITTG